MLVISGSSGNVRKFMRENTFVSYSLLLFVLFFYSQGLNELWCRSLVALLRVSDGFLLFSPILLIINHAFVVLGGAHALSWGWV